MELRKAKAFVISNLEAVSREEILGRKHHDTLTSIGNLALLYDKQGKYSLAEQWYKECAESGEEELGK